MELFLITTSASHFSMYHFYVEFVAFQIKLDTFHARLDTFLRKFDVPEIKVKSF